MKMCLHKWQFFLAFAAALIVGLSECKSKKVINGKIEVLSMQLVCFNDSPSRDRAEIPWLEKKWILINDQKKSINPDKTVCARVNINWMAPFVASSEAAASIRLRKLIFNNEIKSGLSQGTRNSIKIRTEIADERFKNNVRGGEVVAKQGLTSSGLEC